MSLLIFVSQPNSAHIQKCVIEEKSQDLSLQRGKRGKLNLRNNSYQLEQPS